MLTMRKAVKRRTPIRMFKREGSNQRVSSAWVTRPDRSTAARVGQRGSRAAVSVTRPLAPLAGAPVWSPRLRGCLALAFKRISDHAADSLGDSLSSYPADRLLGADFLCQADARSRAREEGGLKWPT